MGTVLVTKSVTSTRSTTTTVTGNPDRTIIGPLTTTFTAPSYCSSTFNADTSLWGSGNLVLSIYTGNCVSGRACYPGTGEEPEFFNNGYYSPGLYCPKDWVTAATIDSNVPRYFTTLEPDESAAFCCPSGLGVYYNDPYLWCSRHPEVQDDRHYFLCQGSHKQDTSIMTTYSLPGTVAIFAGAIQINWRPSDLPTATPGPGTGSDTPASNTQTTLQTSNPTSASNAITFTPNNTPGRPSSSESPSSSGEFSTPQLVGTVVGGVIGTLLCVGVALFIMLKRRRSHKAAAANNGADGNATDVGERAPDLPPRHLLGHPGFELGNSEGAGKEIYELPSPNLTVELEGSGPVQTIHGTSAGGN